MEATARTIPGYLWWLLAALGLVMGLAGVAGGVLGFLLPRPQSDPFGVVLVGVGLAVLLFGGGLFLSALRARRGVDSPLLYSKWGWLICLGVALGLLTIGVLLPESAQLHPAFGLLHVGLVALPGFAGLLLVILAAGRGAAPTLREVLLGLVGGAVSTVAALPLELLGFLLVCIVVIVIAMLIPGGYAEVSRILDILDEWSVNPPADTDAILEIVRSPVVLAVLGLTLAVVAPLIEEAGKTLLGAIFSFWRRPGLATAFVFGVSSGLGFAILEGVSNGALGLGGTGGWVGGLGSRTLATAMHALASGLIGLGWGWAWRRRWWALPLMGLVAVLYHGFWNLNVLVGITGFSQASATGAGPGMVIGLMAVGFELLLIAITPVALLGLPLLLRRAAKA